MKISKRFCTFLTVSCLAVATFFTQGINSAYADGVDWPVYGKDDLRTRNIYDPELKPPIKFKAKMNLGWSVSQTITVGDYFYHIASVPDNNNLFNLPRGTYMYRIPVKFKYFTPKTPEAEVAADLIEKGAKVFRLGDYVKSYSHPTWSAENDAFYVGYDTKVVALNRDMQLLGYYEVGARLVGPPTVYPNDKVLIGAAEGKQKGAIHGVQGIKSKNITGRRYNLSTHNNAEISGAVTKIGNNEGIFGVNHRADIRKSPLVKVNVDNLISGNNPIVWLKEAQTGIPSNAVVEGDHLYHSDKYGGVYKVNIHTGERVWRTQIPNVTLINNSLAIDDKNIYVPVRKPGKVIAISKDTGAITWTAHNGRDKNGNFIDGDVAYGYDTGNDVTAWRTPDGRRVIFYGDTSGQLIFLDQNGNRVDVATDYTNSKINRSYIQATSNNDIPQDWQLQGLGLATETNISKKHLVFGVNHSNNSKGELWFYSVGVVNDMYVESVRGGVYAPNQRVITPVTVGSSKMSSGKRVSTVRFYVDNKLVGQRKVALDPNEKRTVYFDWTTPNYVTSGELKATINDPPEFEEADMTNNMKKANYRIDDSIPISKNSCTPEENMNIGIAGTRQVTDEDGITYEVEYYEFLTTHILDLTPKKIRAGYGFSFKVENEYINELTGALNYGRKGTVTSYFPEDFDEMNSSYKMIKASESSNSDDTQYLAMFDLDKAYVQKYSGKVKRNSFNDNNEDEYVKPEGETKRYTSFDREDGKYPVKVVAKGYGINNLSSCITSEEVEVIGSPFNDYITRSIDPNNPFPGGMPGFNWQGKTTIIDREKDYYNGKEKGDKQKAKLELSPEEINRIKGTKPSEVSKNKAKEFNNNLQNNQE